MSKGAKGVNSVIFLLLPSDESDFSEELTGDAGQMGDKGLLQNHADFLGIEFAWQMSY